MLRRELLLGNGFSMAVHPQFGYGHILDQADVSDEAKAIFAARRTTNFEEVMRVLLAEMRGADCGASHQAKELIQELRNALVTAIHNVHPARRWAIADERYAHCERFLRHFIGKDRPEVGRVFTTNYDLLLTWVTAPEADRKKPDRLFKAFDGFGYGGYQGQGQATVIYLHGALHLFGRGSEIRKLTYVDTGKALHDQVAARLDRREFPVFVSEGASTLKVSREDGYLKEALSRFRATCRRANGSALFTLGHGLGVEDNHILKPITDGKLPAVYLGAFRRQEVEAFKAIAHSWITAREKSRAATGAPPLDVFIYDSDQVAWGPSP